jgi:hypothetical protein
MFAGIINLGSVITERDLFYNAWLKAQSHRMRWSSLRASVHYELDSRTIDPELSLHLQRHREGLDIYKTTI